MKKNIIIALLLIALLLMQNTKVKYKNITFDDEITKIYIDSLEDEIKKYREVSSLDDCVTASVISRNPSYWYNDIIINKGKKDNIKEKDLVINNKGVVGIVNKARNNTSIVRLLTNINDITLKINDSYGILSKYDRANNEFIISEITKNIEYDDDTFAVTTNFTNTFKEGIVIGKLKKIEDDKNGISKNAIITPIVDFNNIKYVCVINDNK